MVLTPTRVPGYLIYWSSPHGGEGLVQDPHPRRCECAICATCGEMTAPRQGERHWITAFPGIAMRIIEGPFIFFAWRVVSLFPIQYNVCTYINILVPASTTSIMTVNTRLVRRLSPAAPVLSTGRRRQKDVDGIVHRVRRPAVGRPPRAKRRRP